MFFGYTPKFVKFRLWGCYNWHTRTPYAKNLKCEVIILGTNVLTKQPIKFSRQYSPWWTLNLHATLKPCAYWHIEGRHQIRNKSARRGFYNKHIYFSSHISANTWVTPKHFLNFWFCLITQIKWADKHQVPPPTFPPFQFHGNGGKTNLPETPHPIVTKLGLPHFQISSHYL